MPGDSDLKARREPEPRCDDEPFWHPEMTQIFRALSTPKPTVPELPPSDIRRFARGRRTITTASPSGKATLGAAQGICPGSGKKAIFSNRSNGRFAVDRVRGGCACHRGALSRPLRPLVPLIPQRTDVIDHLAVAASADGVTTPLGLVVIGPQPVTQAE